MSSRHVSLCNSRHSSMSTELTRHLVRLLAGLSMLQQLANTANVCRNQFAGDRSCESHQANRAWFDNRTKRQPRHLYDCKRSFDGIWESALT